MLVGAVLLLWGAVLAGLWQERQRVREPEAVIVIRLDGGQP